MDRKSVLKRRNFVKDFLPYPLLSFKANQALRNNLTKRISWVSSQKINLTRVFKILQHLTPSWLYDNLDNLERFYCLVCHKKIEAAMKKSQNNYNIRILGLIINSKIVIHNLKTKVSVYQDILSDGYLWAKENLESNQSITSNEKMEVQVWMEDSST